MLQSRLVGSNSEAQVDLLQRTRVWRLGVVGFVVSRSQNLKGVHPKSTINDSHGPTFSAPNVDANSPNSTPKESQILTQDPLPSDESVSRPVWC